MSTARPKLQMEWADAMKLPESVKEVIAKSSRSMCDTFLFGVMLYQSIHWIRIRDKDDRKLYRYMVLWVMLLNIAETVFLMEWNIFNLVTSFGTYRQFMRMNRASWTYIIDALVRTPVIFFFAERAWILMSKNMFFGGLVLLLGTTCVALAVTCKSIAASDYGTDQFHSLLYAWLSIHVVLDVVISATLTILLWRQRKMGSKQTKSIISKALFMMMETQLPPTAFSIAFMMVAGILRGTAWPALFAFSGKVAGTCMLAVVCHKYKMRAQIKPTDVWVYDGGAGGLSGISASRTGGL